jgi:peptidoglycan/xylan/chitin deacetylase (PgdA/CDA1 family)
MRRIFALLLCLCLLPVQARAEAPKYIALTFDDGPSGRFTRRLLDGLAERNAKATFFLCGYRIVDYPQEAERIFAEGHEIAIHGYSHGNMRYMSRREIDAEILKTRALLPEGCEPLWFRPPGGFVSDGVRQVTQCKNMGILHWSIDPQDWDCANSAIICRRVVAEAKDGDVVLLHDMSDSSVDAALTIVDVLRSRGFQFVTVSELARRRRVTVQPGKTYTCFLPPGEEK